MAAVIFREHATLDGHIIAEICLNSERTLNALSQEMIQLINPQLDQWLENPKVVALILDSAGEKAFCAGGDVVGAYHLIQSEEFDAIDDYFANEYRLDYRLQTFPKPILCWASGYVMGGGLGLMNGCSHRVVTETSRLAMPEIAIGLFPDVGASFFLNKLPAEIGYFLALTGSQVPAKDACWLGLADYMLKSEQHDVVLDRLKSGIWNQGDNHGVLSQVLAELSQQVEDDFVQAETPVQNNQTIMKQLLQDDSIPNFVSRLNALKTEDPWLLKARKNVVDGSPLSLYVIQAQLKRSQHADLREVFLMEMQLAAQCCRLGEFAEGVRALLVDKDKSPKWRYDSVEKVDMSVVASYFQSPWELNPLADL
jgi:enoyl-CoA hydratase/carnithine racemase